MDGNILFIDTAYAGFSIGLLRTDGHIFTHFEDTDRGQAEWIVPRLESVLGQGDVLLKDLNQIVINRGPGSFTGIRIGLSTVLGLRVAQNIPLASITSFDCINAMIDGQSAYAIILETKRSDYCVQFFEKSGNPITAPEALEEEDIIAHIEKYDIKNLYGNGTNRFLESSNVAIPNMNFEIIDIEKVLKAIKDIKVKSQLLIEPMYLKPPKISMPKKR